jgi:predicted nucleic acid-binding protein
MATRDAEPVFVDTNVLVYAHVAEAPWHQEAQAAIVEHETAGAPLWVSRQVLREYLVSLTRPQQFPIPPALETVVAQVRQFQQRFHVANEGPEVTTRLLALLLEVPTRGRRIHDANIVATMLVYGVRRLLTNNTDDFSPFAGLIDVLPLLPPPAPAPPSSAGLAP